MSLLAAEWLLRLTVVAGAVALTAAATTSVSDPEGSGPLLLRPATQGSTAQGYDADSLARAVVRANLFRVDRRPAQVAYSPASSESPALVARNSRPSLLLRGVITGDTARALIEGFPNETGSRLVRAGDVIAGLRVASISRTQVRVAGLDTVYLLMLRRSDQ